MIHPGSAAIALVVWLWSDIIADDPPIESREQKENSAESAVYDHLKMDPPTRVPLKKIPKVEPLQIDEEAFHFSFTRQALRKLIPCLESKLSSSGSLSLTGELHKTGKLIKIISTDESGLPTCASEAIEEMDFSNLMQSPVDQKIKLHWSIVW